MVEVFLRKGASTRLTYGYATIGGETHSLTFYDSGIPVTSTVTLRRGLSP